VTAILTASQTGRDEQGAPQKIIGSMKDITRRKEMELASQESRRELEGLVEARTYGLMIKNSRLIQEMAEEKYRSILESMEEGYYEVDLAGNFTFFNHSLTRILGYGEEELKGTNNRHYSERAGMVTYNPETPSIDEWLFEADSRMYQQKRDGKLDAQKQIKT